MALADDVQWLLYILEDDLATLLEACDLHLDYLSNASLVVAEVLDALVILDHARDAQVQAAEDDSLLDVLDKGQNVRVNVESAGVGNVPVDEAVADALAGVTQDLMVELGQALVDLAALAHVVDDVFVENVHLAHLLVHLR